MSKLIRRLAYVNIAALIINTILVWLMLVKSFPPILGSYLPGLPGWSRVVFLLCQWQSADS